MADAPISEELTTLKKRARRRLVGAVALVLVALLLLWTVMDDKPPQSLAAQSVSIVSSEASLASTVTPIPVAAVAVIPSPVANASASASVPTESPNETATNVVPSQFAAVPQSKPLVPSQPTPAPKLQEAFEPGVRKPEAVTTAPAKKNAKETDPAKILAGLDGSYPAGTHAEKSHADDQGNMHFYVQLGAFADAGKAQALVTKAGSAGVTVQNEVIHTEKGALSRLRAGPFASREAAERILDKLTGAGLAASVVGK